MIIGISWGLCRICYSRGEGGFSFVNGVKNGASEWGHISSKASGETKMLLGSLLHWAEFGYLGAYRC
jgi:hypothetical protein